MDEKTEKLVRELADKLGTTTEHLWGVLIKQAPISASVDLAMSFIIVIITVVLFNMMKRVTEDADDKLDPEVFFGWMGFGMFFIIATLIFSSSPEMVVAGFFNPEYWALKQIL